MLKTTPLVITENLSVEATQIHSLYYQGTKHSTCKIQLVQSVNLNLEVETGPGPLNQEIRVRLTRWAAGPVRMGQAG